MRREGRQRGKVMTFCSFVVMKGSDRKFPRLIDGPFMGEFTKAPAKPTNASRYTSRCRKPRCGNCHQRPVTKSRAKTKGKHKHKDENSGFYFFDEACEQNCVWDEESEEDGGQAVVMGGVVGAVEGKKLARQGGCGGDCEDEGWVLVEA